MQDLMESMTWSGSDLDDGVDPLKVHVRALPVLTLGKGRRSLCLVNFSFKGVGLEVKVSR